MARSASRSISTSSRPGCYISPGPGSSTTTSRRTGIETAADIKRIFERNFRFGCEADDPINAVGFDRAESALGAQMRAIFSSDIGHWDVTDMSETVEEAWELVDEGLIEPSGFPRVHLQNAATMWAEADPRLLRRYGRRAGGRRAIGPELTRDSRVPGALRAFASDLILVAADEVALLLDVVRLGLALADDDAVGADGRRSSSRRSRSKVF